MASDGIRCRPISIATLAANDFEPVVSDMHAGVAGVRVELPAGEALVFLTGMEDGVFPHMRSLGDPRELEEERRFLLASIRDLDREREAGDVDDADFTALRDGYVARQIDRRFLKAGLFAGLVGMPSLLGDTHAYGPTRPDGYGFNGIAVALLGRNSPAGIVAAALLWGGLMLTWGIRYGSWYGRTRPDGRPG